VLFPESRKQLQLQARRSLDFVDIFIKIRCGSLSARV
jgi:hypothetical protein